MLVNYSMGLVAENYGIRHLTTFSFAELLVLVLIAIVIFGRLKQNR